MTPQTDDGILIEIHSLELHNGGEASYRKAIQLARQSEREKFADWLENEIVYAEFHGDLAFRRSADGIKVLIKVKLKELRAGDLK